MKDVDDSLVINDNIYSPRFSLFGDTFFLEPYREKIAVNNKDVFEELVKGAVINGPALTIDQLKRYKYSVIDFWGTWCSPCVKDMPKLKRLYEKYKDNDILLVGIAVESDAAKLKKFLDAQAIHHPILFENQKLASGDALFKKMNIEVFPTYLILNERGQVIFSTKSFDGLSERLEELLEE